MQDNRMKKHGAWLATAALVTEMGITGIATAADNPFQVTDLASGYQLAHQDKHDDKQPAKETETSETAKGDQDHDKDDKKSTTEGKCGADHMKLNEGKCGGH